MNDLKDKIADLQWQIENLRSENSNLRMEVGLLRHQLQRLQAFLGAVRDVYTKQFMGCATKTTFIIPRAEKDIFVQICDIGDNHCRE